MYNNCLLCITHGTACDRRLTSTITIRQRLFLFVALFNCTLHQPHDILWINNAPVLVCPILNCTLHQSHDVATRRDLCLILNCTLHQSHDVATRCDLCLILTIYSASLHWNTAFALQNSLGAQLGLFPVALKVVLHRQRVLINVPSANLVTELVVEVAVHGFVCTHTQNHVAQCCIGRKSIVLLGNL